MMAEGQIEIAPLAYMRGRTLSEAFIILDEAQNATALQTKMFLTRLAPRSQTVITGDRTQIDLPEDTRSGLLDIERVLKGVEGIQFVDLEDQDVLRPPLFSESFELMGNETGAKKIEAPWGRFLPFFWIQRAPPRRIVVNRTGKAHESRIYADRHPASLFFAPRRSRLG